jgi:rRNA maturation endonuclease Nob1
VKLIDTAKKSCVIDTSSLINVAKLEIRGELIAKILGRAFQIYAPTSVIAEYKDADREIIIDASKITIVDIEDFKPCLKAMDTWFESLAPDEQIKYSYFNNVKEADKHCLALSLYLSKKEKAPNLLLMDDMRALNVFFPFIQIQQNCLPKTLPEILIFLLSTYSEIQEDHIKGVLRDYKYYNPMKPIREQQLLRSLRSLCRWIHVNEKKYVCSSPQCLTIRFP